MSRDRIAETLSPVELLNTGSVHPAPSRGIALCLSGGGYRAMIFHLGVVWRLAEAGYLGSGEHTINEEVEAGTLERISSVSGGSITAAMLALKWGDLEVDNKQGLIDRYTKLVVNPVRELANHTLDLWSALAGVLLPVTVNKRIISAYRKHLYDHQTLQALPDSPRFVLNATNLQSGALWRFMKPYMRDWKVGEIPNPTIELAAAVAASSAFPPVLSPARFKFLPSQYTQNTGDGLQKPPYTTHPILADGGVYDNLGLETAWKRYKTILVSDAGAEMPPEAKIGSNWVSQTHRAFKVVDNQVGSLRKRQVIGSYVNKDRSGVYWGIRTNIANYKIENVLPCPHEQTMALAHIPTRLKKLDDITKDRLINWGYAVTDAGLRAHVNESIAPTAEFPYPASGVG